MWHMCRKISEYSIKKKENKLQGTAYSISWEDEQEKRQMSKFQIADIKHSEDVGEA